MSRLGAPRLLSSSTSGEMRGGLFGGVEVFASNGWLLKVSRALGARERPGKSRRRYTFPLVALF
eukprot:CAMPEP_0172614680 /NCGR_PEP_ID=MMETSP1068-20121228/54110_1 /TAXON_ID=35684 /ORGANISM="Pseudopedinella elastica, Strain CCMP716" /LENGTH=63 /DNA_ID=CAMNT_0013419559 /DNA_START=521 /DNA_END=712 /DNA_ORIENTATION=-